MSLFNRTSELENKTVDHAQELADAILNYGETIANNLVRDYRYVRELMWNRHNMTLEGAQEVLDKMGAYGLLAFAKLAALGQFIKLNYPGVLQDSELVTPLTYTIDNGRIVLDSGQTYPGPR